MRSTMGFAQIPGIAVDPIWCTATRLVLKTSLSRTHSISAKRVHSCECGCNSTGIGCGIAFRTRPSFRYIHRIRFCSGYSNSSPARRFQITVENRDCQANRRRAGIRSRAGHHSSRSKAFQLEADAAWPGQDLGFWLGKGARRLGWLSEVWVSTGK